jgi:hypothetical protein
MPILVNYVPMITANSDKGIWIDLGKDEPGMILQREYSEGDEN